MPERATIPRTCANCGKDFLAKPSKVRLGQGTACSKSCKTSLQQRGKTGEQSSSWKGGRTGHSKGYVLVSQPDHPRAHNGYVLEHILVMEQKLGRALDEDEVVHHKNEVKDDNRPENLEIQLRGDHTREHLERIDPDEVLQLYREGWNLDELAERYGVLRISIRRKLNILGVHTGSPGPRPDPVKILALYSAGRGVSAIAREVGCTRQSVYKILKKQGIEFEVPKSK